MSEHHCRFIDNAGFLHLVIQVVTLTGTLSNAGKYGISAVLSRDITNQLLNQNGFTYTCSTEQTDLSTLLIRAEQINDLNSGLQYLCRGGLLSNDGASR